MPVEKDSKLREWVEAVRGRIPSLRDQFVEWLGAVRHEPGLIWQTPAVRYTTYGILLFIGLYILLAVLNSLAPPVEQAERAETANFHVLCTNSACQEHFLINREFGFDDFPVKCPKCGQESGQLALKCTSRSCGGRWVVPREEDDVYYCPFCGTALGED